MASIATAFVKAYLLLRTYQALINKWIGQGF